LLYQVLGYHGKASAHLLPALRKYAEEKLRRYEKRFAEHWIQDIAGTATTPDTAK